MVDSVFYIGSSTIKREVRNLINKGVINKKEAKLIFGEGYAKKRNVVMYFALKNQMDYLFFLDDDEYPIAIFKHNNGLAWKGQRVLKTHLMHIQNANITHGHHCGYISPIPCIKFNSVLTEADFMIFIETISNDIISWDSIKEKMLDGGVTYADMEILKSQHSEIVEEINGAKFISGSNLCINLKSSPRLYPFFNPPGARGEDTFLSLCLTRHKVLRVPCYTFHDGFLLYKHLLMGVLPERLKTTGGQSEKIVTRFLKACIGWIRYKPLLLYITERDSYEYNIARIKENLDLVLPKLCCYFGNQEFMKIRQELDTYHSKVQEHFEMFEETKRAWKKIVNYVKNPHCNFSGMQITSPTNNIYDQGTPV
ncbi:MAG: hypothetical protein K6T65_15070 [Peptococcaceae bacterium]|nr:hypothetical protein [Peptococcaceae bacterium]